MLSKRDRPISERTSTSARCARTSCCRGGDQRGGCAANQIERFQAGVDRETGPRELFDHGGDACRRESRRVIGGRLGP